MSGADIEHRDEVYTVAGMSVSLDSITNATYAKPRQVAA
jgi:hypothetical protein